MDPDYASYRKWKGWSSELFGVYSRDQALTFAAELQKSGVPNIAGKTVLEIGFGNGAFAAWAKDNGANYSGTEVIDELLAAGSDAGFNVHDGRLPLSAELAERSLDLVVCFDVLEHFELLQLRDTLRTLAYLLKDSGSLVARVPSGDSPFARAIQHGDATHQTSLGSVMVCQLANDAGLAVAAVREPAFPLAGQGMKTFLRRAVLTGIRTAAFAFITRAFMGGGKPVLSPNMVFVLVPFIQRQSLPSADDR